MSPDVSISKLSLRKPVRNAKCVFDREMRLYRQGATGWARAARGGYAASRQKRMLATAPESKLSRCAFSGSIRLVRTMIAQ
jgi:hypothetical protein